MTQINNLQIEIGAVLSGNFGATLSSGINQLSKLGSTIKQLESSSRNIGKFIDLRKSTLLAKNEWHQAEAQVKSLAQTMNQAENPSNQMIQSFEKSKVAASKAKQAYLEKRDALQILSTKLLKTGVSTGSLVAEQTKLGASLEKLKTKYRELNSIMERRQGVLAQRANLRGQIIDTVAIGAAMAAPIKAAVDFESAMADVKKVVDFKEADGLQKIGDTLKEMSRTIPIAAEGLAQITAAGGQLGIKENDLAEFTDTVAKMSTAFNILPEEAGIAIAQLSNVFQIPIKNMKNLGDAINQISNNMAARAGDIVTALNRAGGVVRQFGLTSEQAAAMVSSLIAMGQMPEKAGTAVAAMLTRLQIAQSQGPKFQKSLEKLGFTASELKQKIKKDAQGAILEFLEAVNKIDKLDRADILVNIFGRNYQKDAALLVGSLNTYKYALGLVADKTKYANSMQKEFENRSKTTANNFQLLKNSLVETGINIGSTLLPALNSIVGALRSITGIFADFAKEYPRLTQGIIGIATALGACKIAALSLGYAWTFIKGGILAIITVWKSLSLVFATNPVFATVTALGVAATLIIANWTKVKSFFINIWDKVQPIWEKFAEFIKGFWETISAPFKSIGKIISGGFGTSGILDSNNTDKNSEKIIKNAAKNPFKNATPIHSNKTQNNNFTINVTGGAAADPKSIKNELQKMLESRDSGALYDFVGGY